MTYDEIVKKIKNHLKQRNVSDYSDCYIGITNDAKRRLFDGHNVNREKGIWIYCQGDSDKVARDVEQYFLAKGCKGGSGGGDDKSTFVYCYKITSTTEQ